MKDNYSQWNRFIMKFFAWSYVFWLLSILFANRYGFVLPESGFFLKSLLNIAIII